MKEELNFVKKNDTWELVELPKGKTAIYVKWVYKIKIKLDGTIKKYKARLVAKGFLQRASLDFIEVFSLMARIKTKRLVDAIVAHEGWKMYQLDMKFASIVAFRKRKFM